MAMTVGFFEEVGRTGRAPLCNWRARLAATMMNRYVLCFRIVRNGAMGVILWRSFQPSVTSLIQSRNVSRIGWICSSIRSRRNRSARTIAARFGPTSANH